MARPVKPDPDKRSLRITYRVTEEEHELILKHAKQARRTVSCYSRDRALEDKLIVKESRVDTDMAIALNRIGTNLNQLVRKFNATGKSPGVSDLSETLTQINSYLDEVQSL